MSNARQYQEVASYYDDFVSHLLHDYLNGNKRVSTQLAFVREAIPIAPSSVLVIGCGIGDVAFELLSLPSVVSVVGLDISEAAIACGRKLFNAPNFELSVLNIAEAAPEKKFDCILLPDVYEHIPHSDRHRVHENIKRALNPRGKVLITVPSSMHQEYLQANGKGLQVVDEVVTFADLGIFAEAIGGAVTYYNMVAVWKLYDYIHAIIETGEPVLSDIDEASRCIVKRNIVDRSFKARFDRRFLSPRRIKMRRKRVANCLGIQAVENSQRKLQ